MTPARAFVLPGVLLFTWLVLATPHGLTVYDLLAGLAAAGVGLLAGTIWPRSGETAARILAAADDLLGEGGEAPSDHTGAEPGGDEGAGDPDALDPDAAPTSVAAVLERLRESLDATRLTVWRVDVDGDEVVPEHADGALPSRLPARGNPLVWALAEGSPLRLDPVPRWARGTAVVAPVDRARVLTVERPIPEVDPGPSAGAEQGRPTDDGAPMDHSALEHAAGILAPFLRLRDQQTHAVAATRRVERMVDFLRSVPSEEEPGRLSMALARSAMEIAGGTGALVASWSGEEGTVLVRQGMGGGPAPGTTFGLMEGDLAHAARTGITVRREPGDGGRPPLASDDERWERPPPPYRTVFPLVDPQGETTGLLAVWGLSRPSDQGVALLEAIAPLQALQLRQADDLERFRARANIDALTGLPNRAALEERMEEERARFHRYRRPLALLVIDLDHFKRINDTHGHDAGDVVLRRVAEALQATIRDVDFAARFGGEELVVVLPETMLRAALDVAERVRVAVETAAIDLDGVSVPVTASVGVSVCPECVEQPDALFASADRALYESKEAGRNRVTAAPGRVVSGGTGS